MPKKTTTKRKSSTKKTTKKRAASKKAVTASFAKPGAPKVKVRGGKMYPPSKIYAQVSPHSVGGVSMFESGVEVNADTAANFTSELGIIQAAADKLREAGFEVLQASESTINIAGSPKTYHEAFGAPITVRQEEVIKEFGLKDKAEFLPAGFNFNQGNRLSKLNRRCGVGGATLLHGGRPVSTIG